MRLRLVLLVALTILGAGCGASEEDASSPWGDDQMPTADTDGWTGYAPLLQDTLPAQLERDLKERGVVIDEVQTDPELAPAPLGEAMRMATPRLPKSGEPEGAYRILPFLVRFTNRREGEAGADEEVTPTFSNRLAWLIVVPAVERGNTSAGKPPQGLASAWSSFVDASTGEWLFSVTTSPLADYR